MVKVLDSWLIIAWLLEQPAAEKVHSQLIRATIPEPVGGELDVLWMSMINAGEVYYLLEKRGASNLAQRWWNHAMPSLPIRFDTPDKQGIWRAASLKSRHPISYADAFAAALTFQINGTLLTGDPEFQHVAGLPLEWLGD